MDIAEYAEQTFHSIRNELLAIAHRFSCFRYLSELDFVPVCCAERNQSSSADFYMHSHNVAEHSMKMGWYTGKTLVDVLSAVPDGPRSELARQQPVRFTVLNSMNVPLVGNVAIGRLVSGVLTCNSEVRAIRLSEASVFYHKQRAVAKFFREADSAYPYLPFVHKPPPQQVYDNATVKSIQHRFVSTSSISAGTIASVVVNQPMQAGDVLLTPSSTARLQKHPPWAIEARVRLIPTPAHAMESAFSPGANLLLYSHGTFAPVHVAALHAVLDARTQLVLTRNPTSLHGREFVHISLILEAAMYMEPYAVCPAMGRFSLHNHGRVVAIGVCTHVFACSVPDPRNCIGKWTMETNWRFAGWFREAVRCCLMISAFDPERGVKRYPQCCFAELNFDVLSIIFEYLAEFDWEPPKRHYRLPGGYHKLSFADWL
eukprot:TRINITY_DN3626_c0_g1_i1.p1 TRINITY_DN3626_c0_g1~~TRINITY_DN3626_c0_g1_i1.p1  ORF type:complete len:429 (-),score=88.92 TRINITY_DN3626_c0_g1_i1:37-1323(-)